MMPPRSLALAAGVFAVVWICTVAEAADEPSPVPAAADLEKAQTAIRELYKSDFAKTKQTDRLALASKLFKESLETKSDPAARFALLREARDLAAKSGDAPGVLRITDEMTARFAVKPADALGPALDPLAASTNSAVTAKMIAEVLLVAADEARFSGDWQLNAAILKAASAVAGKTTGLATNEKVRAKAKDAELGRAESEKAKEAFETLKTKPADPAANTIVGRFLAFFQQDWEEGVDHLSRGADEKLQITAQKDLKAAGGGGDEQIAAGDAWYDQAAAAEPGAKAACQIRAHHWYVEAFPTQAGLNKTRLEKRIAELQSVVDAKADRTDLWRLLRRGVGEERTAKGRIVGGAFAEKTFEEGPTGGGYLIGFHYTLAPNKLPNYMQPIYMTPFGEVVGASYGVVGKRDTPKATIKAKPGYAIGALVVRGGGGFDAFKPVFMRVTGTGLNKNDTYEGAQIGGMGGSEGTLGGDGNFIVGIHGKVQDKTGKIEALSIISLADEKAPPVPKKKKKK
jgi:hypothetical protein